MSNPVHVAVGVILNHRRQVLISLRHRNSHQGGLWEFPGGKLEAGESVSAALSRELREELGISTGAHHPVKKICHSYGDKTVLLDVWVVREFSGEPEGKEGQEIRWCNLEELNALEFPAANAGIIDCLRLPCQIAITPDVATEAELLSLMDAYARLRPGLIQLRQTHLDCSQLLEMATIATNYLASNYPDLRLRVLLNTSPEFYKQDNKFGLHLNSVRLMTLTESPAKLAKSEAAVNLISASCHNLEQLKKAEEIGVDLALLSPVLPTNSHPETEVLGWHQFQQLAASVSIPVYALGGVGPDLLNQAYSCGAHGVAGVSAYSMGLSNL